MSGSGNDRLDVGLKNLLNKAIELDNRGMKKEACQYYLRASKILIKLSKSTSLPSVRLLFGNIISHAPKSALIESDISLESKRKPVDHLMGCRPLQRAI
jgi:hypothetical protein